jgi:hypothetical protein
MSCNPHEAAWAATVRVAVANAVRGLLLHEREQDPQVGSVVVEADTGGAIDVRLQSEAGLPIAGYSL